MEFGVRRHANQLLARQLPGRSSTLGRTAGDRVETSSWIESWRRNADQLLTIRTAVVLARMDRRCRLNVVFGQPIVLSLLLQLGY